MDGCYYDFFFKFKKIVKLSYKINRIGHGKIYPKHELSQHSNGNIFVLL